MRALLSCIALARYGSEASIYSSKYEAVLVVNATVPFPAFADMTVCQHRIYIDVSEEDSSR
jgi:hypothetical protein